MNPHPLPDGARIARVVDVETTGLPDKHPNPAMVEIAWYDLDLATLEIVGDGQTYVNPGHPITAETRAVHHISDADVADAPTAIEALMRLNEGLGNDDLLCAHHDKFERHFIGEHDYGRSWIDTYRCALRAWPDHFPHGNQLLRYALGFDEREGFHSHQAMPPHRALPDAYVTAWILRDLLQLRPAARLIEISTEPGFLPRLTFGKHYGVLFKEAPKDYLAWLVRQPDMDGDVVFTAQWWLDRK